MDPRDILNHTWIGEPRPGVHHAVTEYDAAKRWAPSPRNRVADWGAGAYLVVVAAVLVFAALKWAGVL